MLSLRAPMKHLQVAKIRWQWQRLRKKATTQTAPILCILFPNGSLHYRMKCRRCRWYRFNCWLTWRFVSQWTRIKSGWQKCSLSPSRVVQTRGLQISFMPMPRCRYLGPWRAIDQSSATGSKSHWMCCMKRTTRRRRRCQVVASIATSTVGEEFCRDTYRAKAV